MEAKIKEDKKKIENLILHFAQKEMLHLGKKKLAKLLYFTDFTSQELLGRPITGMRYEKWQFGPVPATFYKHLDRLEVSDKISIDKAKVAYIPETITTDKKPDYSVFSAEELKIINSITEQYKSSSAAKLEGIAKNEPPYKMVKEGEIPYHLAYYRNTFDEMALNEDSVTS